MKKLYTISLFLMSFIGFSQVINLQPFGPSFTDAVAIAHAKDSRLFVVEQAGIIKILNANGTVNATNFLNISSIITSGGERGLLGLAFHPDYAINGYFYINYTNLLGDTVIARYSVSSANANVANPTGVILMTIDQPYSNHNGGNLKFGPDGFLYIGLGDGGSGGDPQGYAQNMTINPSFPSRIFLGKMLRINPNINVAPYYTIPASNPFANQAGKAEIWATGLRNPWKYSFNRLNGDLWIADVGQLNVEEINKVSSPMPNTGLNFGWKCYEGNATYNTSGCIAASGLTFPLAQYTHANSACSITGGYVYTGTLYPNLLGKYLCTDYCDDKIRMVDNAGNIVTTATFAGNNFSSFGEDFAGELYIIGLSSGTIFKITDSSLSTNDFSKNSFTIISNDNDKTFTIKSNPNNIAKNCFLNDLSGKLVLSQNFNNNQDQTISTANLSKGIYLISIEAENGTSFNSKLVVE